jgi:hypothetical protein
MIFSSLMPRAYGRLFILQDENSEGFFTASFPDVGLQQSVIPLDRSFCLPFSGQGYPRGGKYEFKAIFS